MQKPGNSSCYLSSVQVTNLMSCIDTKQLFLFVTEPSIDQQMWYYRWWIELVKNGYAHWYSGFSTLRSWAIKHSGVCIYCGKVKVLELQGHPHSHHFTRLFTLWTALQGWRLSCRTRLPAKDVSSFGLDSPHCYLPPKGRRGASFKKRFYISSDPLLILEKIISSKQRSQEILRSLQIVLLNALSEFWPRKKTFWRPKKSYFAAFVTNVSFSNWTNFSAIFRSSKEIIFFKKNSILTFPIAKA